MPALQLFIAEDEPPALARLVEALRRVAPQAVVAGAVGSVQAARQWLATHPSPDLMLLDIQLADGLSLALFDPAAGAGAVRPAAPVVFTTAHDAFVLEAFRCNAIDYLLKPVRDEALAASLQRYESLRRHFTGNLDGLIAALNPAPGAARGAPWRQRLVLRRGAAFASVRCDEVAWCVSVDKLAFVLTRGGERLLADETLAELEAGLDPARFFRANRQVLVHIDAVKSFRPHGKGQLKLQLAPEAEVPVLVSQERARAFRDWMGAGAA